VLVISNSPSLRARTGSNAAKTKYPKGPEKHANRTFLVVSNEKNVSFLVCTLTSGIGFDST